VHKEIVVGITAGDPAGIGPEVVCKALSHISLPNFVPVVIGTSSLISQYIGLSKLQICDINELEGRQGFLLPRGSNKILLLNLTLPSKVRIKLGKPQRAAGLLSYLYIKEGIKLATEGKVDGIVTAPICKKALHLAGIKFIGHTEMLAKLTNSSPEMLMLNKEMRIILVTRHLPLSDVGKVLTVKRVYKVTLSGIEAMRELFNIEMPRVAVCGFNPHAGEGGILGKEEKIISSAVKKLLLEGYRVEGPLPADSVFHPRKRQNYDLIVAMYHDQAMLPLKSTSPESIVNLTVGLPFIRTSPGHGTAYDIAGKNIADPRPMIEAINVAYNLIKRIKSHRKN
jgi:4-hydroxythreonine-4-phosphate dehydrogenase